MSEPREFVGVLCDLEAVDGREQWINERTPLAEKRDRQQFEAGYKVGVEAGAEAVVRSVERNRHVTPPAAPPAIEPTEEPGGHPNR